MIAQPCVGAKHRACVEVCPVDCIESGPRAASYFIDPARCTDCGLCVPACPVQAIFPETELPARWSHFREANAAFFRKEWRHGP